MINLLFIGLAALAFDKHNFKNNDARAIFCPMALAGCTGLEYVSRPGAKMSVNVDVPKCHPDYGRYYNQTKYFCGFRTLEDCRECLKIQRQAVGLE